MIYFKCSQCNEHLEAPTSMSGEKLQCPVCKFPEIVPEDEDTIRLDAGDSAGGSAGSNVSAAGGVGSAVEEAVGARIGSASGSDDGSEKISMAEMSGDTKFGITGTSQIKAFGKDHLRKEHKWNRKPVKTGVGACRVKLFHSRLSPNAMEYMEDSINEWLDENPDIEVKFSESTVGVVEGKKSEAHILITVWY